MDRSASDSTAKAVQAVRTDLARGQRHRARSLAHLMLDHCDLRVTGYLCSAIVSYSEGFSHHAKALFERVPIALAEEFAPLEFLVTQIITAQESCHKLSRLLTAERITPKNSGELRTLIDRAILQNLVTRDYAETLLAKTPLALEKRHPETQGSLEINAPSRKVAPRAVPQSCAAITGVWDNFHATLTEPAEKAVPLILLALLKNQIQGLVDPNEVVLISATSQSAYSGRRNLGFGLPTETGLSPTNIWLMVSGPLDASLFDEIGSTPLADRCILLSMQLADNMRLPEEMRKWLQSREPIGCRDFTTLLLLRQAGIKCFLAGSPLLLATDVATTLESWSVRQGSERDLAIDQGRLQRALGDVRSLEVTTAAPASRANPTRYLLDMEGLTPLADTELKHLRYRFRARVAALLRAIRNGTPDSVMETWRAVSLPDVEAANTYARAYHAPVFRAGEVQAIARPTVQGVEDSVVSENQGSSQIEIAVAVDTRLSSYLPVLLESVLETSSLPVRFHLLTRGLTSSDYSALKRDFPRTQFAFYALDSARYGDELRLLPHTTLSTLDRLVLPELVVHLDRIIYLDVDLIVFGDLAELWNLELNDKRLAAKSSTSPNAQYVHQMVHNALGRLPFEQASNARRYLYDNFEMLSRAFNAGVLVMNLARMREENFTQRFLPMVEHYGMNDQDALNVYAGSERVELPPEWNVIPRQDLTDGAKIVHFAGPVKPWSEFYIHRACCFKAYETKYLARTGRSRPSPVRADHATNPAPT